MIEVTLVFSTGECEISIALMRDGIFFIISVRSKADAAKSSDFALRLSRNNESDVFHLLARGKRSIEIIRTIAHPELHATHRAKAAKSYLFTFPIAFLRVSPVASSAKRFAICWFGDHD